VDTQAAIVKLRQQDQILSRIIDRIGVCQLKAGPGGFAALARSIIGQQLSKVSAQAIFSRLQTMCHGGELQASQLDWITDKDLRETGLSSQKISYLRDLAWHTLSGSIDFCQIATMDDESVVQTLKQVRGIGQWTAEMYLMFSLGRMDVFPISDLALRTSMNQIYGLRAKDPDGHARDIAEKWRPYRSVASWYLYAHLDESRKKDGDRAGW